MTWAEAFFLTALIGFIGAPFWMPFVVAGIWAIRGKAPPPDAPESEE